MTLRLVIILTGLCWTYQSTKAIQLCDNGKFHVELDLPHPSALHCSEPLPDLVQQQVFIDQKYPAPLQPVKHVCMDTPISYNVTIPSRGDHRSVSAEPGVYLYCPPQRWLNNLQHGSIVVLHHPCAAEEERSRLAALALSCLPGFIMTPHPWLSKHRPLALVSWGRTLEMSHVTTSAVCDWLVSVSSENRRHIWPMKRPGERRYSLLLTHAAPLQRPKESTRHTHAAASHIDWLKNLRQCCEQTLSSPDQNGDTQPTDETTRTQRREEDAVRRRAGGERTQRRRKRAAIPPRQADQRETPISQVNNTTRLNNNSNNNETDLHTAQLSQLNYTSSTPSAGVLVGTHQPAAGTEPMGSTVGPGRVTAHLSPPKEDEEHEQGGGGPEKKKEELLVVEKEVHTRTDMQGQGGGNSSGAPAATAAATGGGVGGGRGGNSSGAVGGPAGGDHSLGGATVAVGAVGGGVSGIQGGNSSAGGHSSGGGVQRKVTGAARTKSRSHSSSSSHARAHSQSHHKERLNQNPAAVGGGGGGGGGVKTSARQRVREDTEEQERLEGLEHQGRAAGGGGTSTEVPGQGFGGRVAMGSMGVGGGGGGDRFVTRRTDEAVWAAAALGFLLVLLTLSVLHTRLYRHWRTMPSLYWRDDTQDYDSVTDIIRRRLKLAGRRKRRAAAARRHEAPLLPNSSTDEEFE